MASARPRLRIAPSTQPQMEAPAASAPITEEATPAGLPEMVTVTVARPYTLTLDTGGTVHFQAGVQEMQIDHAEHWWSRQHGGVQVYQKET